MFIPLPTFISDSRVSTFQGLYPGFFIGTLISLIIDGYRLWQYGLWSFQTRGTKLERFLPKNQHSILIIGLVGASEVFKN